MKRLVVAVAAVTGALLLQLTIVNGLPWPGGGAPDLVLLCVVAIGLVAGPQPGIVAGFCAGLALDVAPPANELIGQYALVFCLVGYCCGRLRPTLRQSAVLALAAAAGVVVAGELLSSLLVLVLDTPQATLAAVAHELPVSVVYDLVLSPLVMFAAFRIAVALGMSFDPGEDSPALETGGSARPMGLARLARLRQLRHSSIGAGSVGIGWLTGDSAAEAAPVGAVGWLKGPATSRRARREQARLTAALTGAAPRKGAFWVGSRPPGVRPASTAAPPSSSALSKLRPDNGVAGSAMRAGVPAPGRPAPGLPNISFSGGKTAGSPSGRTSGGGVPKISFGTGGLPGAGRASGRGVPKITFKTGGLAGVPEGGRPATGAATPKISFGTGGLPGAGRASGRGVPKIAFGSGDLARASRTNPARPALPRFRTRSSATGQWLAGSRLRDSGFKYVSSSRPIRRRRGIGRWLPWLRRSGGRVGVRVGGRSGLGRVSRNLGGER